MISMRAGGGRSSPIVSALGLILLALFPAGLAMAQDIGGYTNMSRDPGHGTQIEYVARDGKTYLWYPGNARILQGHWKLQDGNMCFAYGPNSYNPVTEQRGGWECEPLRTYQRGIAQRLQGDPLRLKGRRAVPFDLTRAPASLEQALALVRSGTQPPASQGPVTSGEQALTCRSIIANAERSRSNMSMAASAYFHGMFMGRPCVDVDYARAFDLARRAGDSVEPFLRTLRERAANGHPTAIAALKLLGP